MFVTWAAWRKSGFSRTCFAMCQPGSFALSHLQHRQECFLRNIHTPDALHASLAFLLLLQQLALARNVAAVALGNDVLADRRHRLAGNDLRPNRRLDRDLE